MVAFRMPQTMMHKGSGMGPVPLAGFSAMEENILGVLAYFDIFHYPLRAGEIRQFREDKGREEDLDAALEGLVNRGIIFHYEEFFSLQDNPLLAYRRREGNQRAAQLLPLAIRKGRFLQRFPYVRAVGISGALSKDYADARSDFDFFIITEANRLWIARTFMHLFKKLTFLTGKQHFYCMNYYLDEEFMTLGDQNIFTAVELKTLLPVNGSACTRRLFEANHWANERLPFCPFREQPVADRKKGFGKRLLEWLFNNRLGDRLDNYLLRVTSTRWKKKEEKGKRNSKGELMKLITSKHYSKSNPGAFQEKVLALYEQKMSQLLSREA